jgi:aspartokinase/homoserine dehydrogenase 1
MSRIEVHKFGGTSVAGSDRIASVAGLARGLSRSHGIVVVSSAMAGVTDALVAASADAADGRRREALERVDGILDRHLETLYRLQVDDAPAVRRELEDICNDLAELVRAVDLLAEMTPRTRDRLLSCGEKLTVRLIAAAIRKAGGAAEPFDADRFVETDDHFGEASPLPGAAHRSIRATLDPLLEAQGIPVVTGFCGRAPDGATTTLGRGGSDLSATLIAAALSADEVTIWTDVDGVFSADPRQVPEARVLRHLHFREAAEMSFYGAKVLHQRSMIPVVGPGVAVRVRNSFRPEQEGTRVDGRYTPGSHPVKAISAVGRQSLVSVEGKGMAGVPGVAARVFRALGRQAISVTMISQSSSESSICLAVPAEHAVAAEIALKQEFRPDLARGEIEEIQVLGEAGLLAAVGLGMAHTPGIAARVFGALARKRVNVLAIAQGSSELNITLAVDPENVPTAVAAIHREFGLHRKDTGEDLADRLDVMLVGFGQIGRSLADLLHRRAGHILQRFGLQPRIVAVGDRSGFVFRPTGIPPETLDLAAGAKRDGRSLATLEGATAADTPMAMLRHALEYRLSRPVLVDVSDADGSHELFLEAFRLGADVVTANKKPLAGEMDLFRELLAQARSSQRLLKAEATVGAGLPVVDTLEILLAAGDRLLGAEGCLSGTLGFLMTRLEEGAPLSTAVEEAVGHGYTEPDPVADLSGADVMRKAMILARMSGLVEDGAEIRLTGLVDPSLAGLERAALLARIRENYDARIAERVGDARGRGEVLRYVARVRPGAIDVGPETVPLDSPLGRLQGTDNMIVFTSERYRARPLVVTGPGAGIEVTAMGVLGDVLRIAAERK